MAQQQLEQIVREKQSECAGILLPQQAIRKASQTPLTKRLCDYAADLQTVGRDSPIYLRTQKPHSSPHA